MTGVTFASSDEFTAWAQNAQRRSPRRGDRTLRYRVPDRFFDMRRGGSLATVITTLTEQYGLATISTWPDGSHTPAIFVRVKSNPRPSGPINITSD